MNGRYSTQQFTYIPSSKTFLTDMSDLGWKAGERKFKQIYPDACDEGLTLVSHKTGIECDYVVVNENPEFIELKPVSGRRGQASTDTRVVLVND